MGDTAITSLSLEEARAQIVAKFRDALNLDPDIPVADQVQNMNLEELRSGILQQAREKLGILAAFPSASASDTDYTIDMEDMRTRMLFYRIKNSNIPRMQREALSGFVRTMAADNRVDSKLIKSVSEMIMFMEMTSWTDRRKEIKTFPLEKSVNDEMDAMYSLRSQREAQQERLESLRESISA